MRIVRITDRNMTKVTATKEYRKTSSLRNWDKNPRAIKKDRFEELKARITRRGQYKPLVVTDDGEVLGGNMRLRAFNDLDIEDAWVSVVHPESEADKIAIALEDNEEMGYYDSQELAELIDQYKEEIDLTKYSVHLKQAQTLRELLDEFGEEVVEDEAPEVEEGEPESKLGEVYQLGRHRLMCGDSTKIEDVEKLMDGNKADMVFTDPPYNIGYIGGASSRRTGILNDKMSKSSFYTFLYDSFSNLMKINKGSFYICMGHKEVDTLKIAFEQSGGHFQTLIIWVKNKFTLSGSDYQNQYEVLLYGWVEGKDHYFIDDRGQGVIWYEVGKKSKFVDGKTEIRIGTTKLILDGKVTGTIERGKRKTDVWEYDRPTESKEHPTMKPLKLIVESIKNSTHVGDVVADVFLGSGSTLIACEQTDRICYGMELDPKYADVIRKRYWKFTHDNDEEGWIEGTNQTGL
jgi:DNA modification methylase